jgi:hypothetical protein
LAGTAQASDAAAAKLRTNSLILVSSLLFSTNASTPGEFINDRTPAPVRAFSDIATTRRDVVYLFAVQQPSR